MVNNYMMSAAEVAEQLGTSKNFAYSVIRNLNKELKERGFVVVSGKVPRAFWEEKFYSQSHKEQAPCQ